MDKNNATEIMNNVLKQEYLFYKKLYYAKKKHAQTRRHVADKKKSD